MDIHRAMREFGVENLPVYVDREPFDITKMVEPHPLVILFGDGRYYCILMKINNAYMCVYLSSNYAEVWELHRDYGDEVSPRVVINYNKLVEYIHDVHNGFLTLDMAQTIADEMKSAINGNRLHDSDSIVFGVASRLMGKSARGN